MLTIFSENLLYRCLTGSPIRLWQYISTLFNLKIILNLEMHIFSETYVYGYPEEYLGHYQTSRMSVFHKIWADLDILVLKLSKNTARFSWESAQWSPCWCLIQIWNCSLKGIYDCTVLHNTDSSYSLTYWLV